MHADLSLYGPVLCRTCHLPLHSLICQLTVSRRGGGYVLWMKAFIRLVLFSLRFFFGMRIFGYFIVFPSDSFFRGSISLSFRSISMGSIFCAFSVLTVVDQSLNIQGNNEGSKCCQFPLIVFLPRHLLGSRDSCSPPPPWEFVFPAVLAHLASWNPLLSLYRLTCLPTLF